MKVWIAIIVLLVVVASCQSGKNKEPNKPPPEIVSNSGWDGSVYQVEHWLKQSLKDPESFQAIEWGAVTKTESGFMVRCKYRAKNSFGGSIVSSQMFILDATGKVTSVVDIQ